MHSKCLPAAIALTVIATYNLGVARAEPAGDAASVLKQAKELIKKDKFQEAIDACTRVLATDPKNTEALTRRGQAYGGAGKAAEALKDFEDALALDPTDRNIYVERARFHDAQNASAAAIQDLTKALAIKNDLTILQLRAQIYEKSGKLAGAIADYTEILKSQPSRGDLLVARGRAQRLSGDGEKAAEDFARATRINPGYQLLVNKALGEGTGKPRVMKPTLASVMPPGTSVPEPVRQPDAHLVVVPKTNKIDQTTAVEVAKATPAPAAQSQVAAQTSAPVNTPPAPTSSTPAAAPPAPPTPDPEAEKTAAEAQLVNATIQAGRNQLTAKQYPEAVASFTKVIELRPKLAEGYIRRCAANYLSGNTKPAIEDCTKGLQINMRDADAYYYRGRAYLDTKEHARAIENLSNAIGLKPYFPEAHFYRAQAYQALDNLSQAIYGYSEAARQKQGFIEALEARAALKLYLGDRLGQQHDLELIKTASAARK